MTVEHSGRRWLPFIALLVVVATAAAMAVGFGRVNLAGAQDEGTPAAEAGRPAHIHSGSCNDTADDALGDVVQPLTNVAAPTGAAAGQADAATAVETSVTTVPMALEDILAEDHAVNVHLSVEEVTTYIACGEVGGTVSDADGSVTIGLREQDGSGFAGVAYLAPGADGASTVVSVFLAEGLAGGGGAAEDEGAAEEETPAAEEEDEATEEAAGGDTGDGEEIAVSIVDFAFEPAEVTVPVGGTVTWTNDGERNHTATAQDRDVLQSGTIDSGASYSETFDEAGTYEYFCEFHPDMEGTIIVE